MKLSEIKANPNNPRLIKDDKFKKLVKSIKEFPKMMALRPMVVDADGVVLGGNMRLKALQELNYKDIPDEWVKRASDLTEDEARRFIIADNVGFGENDWDMLANNWDADELAEWGLDLPSEWGGEELEAEEDNFDIPDTIETSIILGDLITFEKDGKELHRLLCGDSTDSDSVAKLMNGEKADMVFTDPPYGVDYDGGHAVKGVRREKLANDGTPDIYNDSLPMMYLYSKKDTPLYLWYSDSKSLAVLNAVLNAGYEIRTNIIWNKNVAQFGAIGAQYKIKHESCLYCHKKGQKTNWTGANNEVSVWDIDRNSKNEHHPTQKPIALAERCIKNHEVEIVLDLFLGSGSTMVAAHELKRKCYGMELSEKYCQVIIDRMKKLDDTLEIKINGIKTV